MDFINLIGSFVKNLAISGSIVALSLTLLDYIGKNINYVGFYAFISGSFFWLIYYNNIKYIL